MNKEEIKKEFDEYYRPEDFKCGGCLECEACKLHLNVLWEKTADFWLSKLDAYKSSLLERINKIKKEENWRKIETYNKGAEVSIANDNSIYNEGVNDSINLIKEGKE